MGKKSSKTYVTGGLGILFEGTRESIKLLEEVV